ncbi:protein shisa-5-like [Engraulis encrasicolus]|uniref:protein shisa-5-like n=1 Tax=Engraulis encrasicolus TaxID=184585 RepID=UPI002FD627FD
MADNCKRYYKGNRIEGPKVCEFGQSCCGSCENRYCCPFPSLLELVTSHIVSLSEEVQDACPNNFFEYGSEDADFRMFLIVAIAVVGVILISLIIFCCVCPCCCLYQMCRKPRPVVTSNTRTTVVVNNAPPPHAARAQQHHGPPPPQQQQYHPAYQPVAMQSWPGSPAPAQGYDGHPVPSAPMLPDVYGPPPPYNESAIGGNYNQRAFTQGPASYY